MVGSCRFVVPYGVGGVLEGEEVLALFALVSYYGVGGDRCAPARFWAMAYVVGNADEVRVW